MPPLCKAECVSTEVDPRREARVQAASSVDVSSGEQADISVSFIVDPSFTLGGLNEKNSTSKTPNHSGLRLGPPDGRNEW
jgi:hypothetical protein